MSLEYTASNQEGRHSMPVISRDIHTGKCTKYANMAAALAAHGIHHRGGAAVSLKRALTTGCVYKSATWSIVPIEPLEGEKWCPIQGTTLSVSTMGRLKRTTPNTEVLVHGTDSDDRHIFRMDNTQNLYIVLRIRTSHGRTRRQYRLGELVLTHFGYPKSPEHRLYHINHDPSDNRLANLIWASGKSILETKEALRVLVSLAHQQEADLECHEDPEEVLAGIK